MKVSNVAGALSALLLLSACGQAIDGDDVATRGQPIIFGSHADSPLWNHTGGLVLVDEAFGEAFHFCTGTLISSETVVTAKHCADLIADLAGLSGLHFEWAGGPRLEEAVERIPIVAFERSPVDEGGFVLRGQDVAVVHLDSESSLAPASIGQVSDELLGRRMISLGYGVHGARGRIDDQRRIGRETVRVTSGRTFEAIFGDFESFVEWAFTGNVTDEDFLEILSPDDPFLDLLREDFEGTQILDGHEAVTGNLPGDTQSCNGDSGGPLGLFVDGTYQTFGVVSGGLSSLRLQCDFGTVFSTFGPEAFAFVQQGQSWVDPCGDVSALGSCDGTVVNRCVSSLAEGTREPTTIDCAETGRLCVETDLGALCGRVPGLAPGAPASDPAADEAAAEEEPAPSSEQLAEHRKLVESRLRALDASFFPPVASRLPWRE